MLEPKAFYINGRFFTHKITGVQRFAYELTKRLVSNFDVKILVPRGTSVPSDLPFEEVGRNRGHVWEQFDLPIYLKARRSPLLLNLANTGPISYKNQIATHHDITYIRFPKSFSWKFRTSYRYLIPIFLRNAKFTITSSEFSKGEICSEFSLEPQRMIVVPCGVDHDQFKPGKTRDKFFLLVSSPSLHKNFSIAITAFAKSSLAGEYKLKIVGSVAQAFRPTAQNGHPSVVWLGRVEDDELLRLYQTASAFVFPSVYEGFGIPPLEAQASGCPVISSNAASMPEVLRQSVLYFEPNDAAMLTRRMEEVANSSDLQASLVNKGFENASRFSWDYSYMKVAEIINTLKDD